jgi:hypothetical protein
MCLYKYWFCDLNVIVCTNNILHPGISVTNTDVEIFVNIMEILPNKGQFRSNNDSFISSLSFFNVLRWASLVVQYSP